MVHVPLNWLGDLVALPDDVTPESVAAALVRVGLEEESINGPTVTGPLVVGRVLTQVPEEQKNGKTINWCTVDVGELNVTLDDGTQGRGIVCGAHNFGPGDLVVCVLPGAVLPGPFPIAARKTYGHVSDGMICSLRELGLGEDHDGIIVLDRLEGYGFDAADLVPGQDAIELLGLGETSIEVNVNPDRGYCFALRGIAREYSHSTGAAFTDPAAIEVPVATDDGYPVLLRDDAPIRGNNGCDRFVTRVVRGVAASSASPTWMRRRLTLAGMRPISLAVDVTNYVMLELGQPMHAYDLDQVHGPILVRRAKAGEKLKTLDDVVRVLDTEDLLITDSGSDDDAEGSRVLGLAGVMGGAESEISPATVDLLLEAAHFDAITVARTARRHKLSSEASKRFERGSDPALPARAMQRAVELLTTYGGGEPDLAVTDVDERVPAEPIEFEASFIGRIAGVGYTDAEVRETLALIGAHVEDGAGTSLRVTAPSWRPDLTAAVDYVEEVARLRGYDQIPSTLPSAPAGRGLSTSQRARRSVANLFAARGLVETLSYPFVSENTLEAQGVPEGDKRRSLVRLLNPLSDESPFLRSSLLSTLVDTARRNIGRGASDLAIFELGLVTLGYETPRVAPILGVSTRPSDEELAIVRAAVPHQPRHAAGVLVGQRELPGVLGAGRKADYADAIALVQDVAELLHVTVSVRAAEYAPWHPGRCAEFVLADGTVVGHAGELHPKALKLLELPDRAVAFELDLDALIAEHEKSGHVQATPVSTYPLGKEDIALVVPDDVSGAELLEAVKQAAGDLAESVRLFDVYTGTQLGEGKKSVAFSLRLRAQDRTLTAEDAGAVRNAVIRETAKRFGAELRA